MKGPILLLFHLLQRLLPSFFKRRYQMFSGMFCVCTDSIKKTYFYDNVEADIEAGILFVLQM